MNYLINSTDPNLLVNLINNPLLTNHIKYSYKDIIGNQNNPDYRKYKDETTSLFNKTFFEKNGEDTLNNFTFYLFQKINFDIISNINNHLNIYDENLKHNEDIILVYKGGNVINYYLNKILNVINEQDFNTFINDLSIKKISDTDFSIYIITNDEKRYNLIYYHMSILLYNSLLDIRDSFEKLFNKRFLSHNDSNIFQINKIEQSGNGNINSDKGLIYDGRLGDIYILRDDNYSFLSNENILTIDNLIQIELDKCIFDDIILLDPVKRRSLITSFIIIFIKIFNILDKYKIIDNNKFSLYKDIYTSARYIKILYSISTIINIYFKYYPDRTILTQQRSVKIKDKLIKFLSLYDNINNIINLSRTISNICLDNVLFDLNNFYTTDNIGIFLNDICNKFNENEYRYSTYYDYDYNNSIKPIAKYQMRYNELNDRFNIPGVIVDLVVQPDGNDVSINYERNGNNDHPHTFLSKRNDIILKNIPLIEYNELVSNKEENYHYISVNNIINFIIDGSHLVQFDLYRIKLNLSLSHIVKIDIQKNHDNKKSVIKLNIPSEFLDVSIPNFNDYGLTSIRNKIYNNNKLKYGNFFSRLSFGNRKNILMYNLSYLIQDLSVMLLKQNSFIPWVDVKYTKRISRLVLLSCFLIIKNSIVHNKYLNMKGYLTLMLNDLKSICQNLFSYYNRNTSSFGQSFRNNMIKIGNATRQIGNNNINIINIKEKIDNYIINNPNQILFSEPIIKNFEKNDKYFIFDSDKLNKIMSINNNFNFNLIFGDCFNSLLEFLFRNIIYDIVKPSSLYTLVDYLMNRYKIIFDNDAIKNTYINNIFKIENYKCIKCFTDIFEKVILYMLFNNDPALQSAINRKVINIPNQNLQFGGNNNDNNKSYNISFKNIFQKNEFQKNEIKLKIQKNSITFNKIKIEDIKNIELTYTNTILDSISSTIINKKNTVNYIRKQKIIQFLKKFRINLSKKNKETNTTNLLNQRRNNELSSKNSNSTEKTAIKSSKFQTSKNLKRN